MPLGKAIALMIKDRRNAPQSAPIPAELKAQGIAQLEAEIATIENWLADLNETRDDNPASIAARITYQDMMQSRREFLKTLRES